MTGRQGTRTVVLAAATAVVLAAAGPGDLRAQTDFYNLDKGRPLRVEDAYGTKRYAFELKVSPLTLSQGPDRIVRYQPNVEIKHGILPGLDVSAGLGLGVERPGEDGTRRTDTELELASLLNLTTETRRLPALAVRLTGHLPLEGDHGRTLELRGIATRSLAGPVRGHLNGGWTFGDDAAERWWAGLALDYVLPFHHFLILGEAYVADPVEPESLTPAPPPGANGSANGGGRRVHTTAGFRYQLNPVMALDAGVGRSWTGDTAVDWLLTLGFTYEFAVRSLMPRHGR